MLHTQDHLTFYLLSPILSKNAVVAPFSLKNPHHNDKYVFIQLIYNSCINLLLLILSEFPYLDEKGH